MYKARTGNNSTHVRYGHHLLCDNVVEDEGESDLIIIIQKGINSFLQTNQTLFFLQRVIRISS